MSNLILNAGLWVNGAPTFGEPAEGLVNFLTRCAQLGATVEVRLAGSGEPTAVTNLPEKAAELFSFGEIYKWSVACGQDRIAGKTNNKGFLIGPNPDAFGGEFRQEFFLE